MLAASMAIIGCAGSGGGGGGGGGTNGGAVEASVNTALFINGPVSKPGYMVITYNTGQGRGVDPVTATIKRVVLEDTAFGQGSENNIIRTLLNPELVLQLDGYTSNSVSLNAPMDGFATNLNHRFFENFVLELQEVTIEGSTFQGPGGQAVVVEQFDLNARTFPGRTTSIEIFLNDAMVAPDGLGGVAFDRNEFEALNYNPDSLKIEAHLSDYLAFDISNIANQPLMTGGGPATTVYFSGDAIGLSDTPVGTQTVFEVLVPESPEPGSILGWVSLAPSFPPNSPNTYTLRQVDPRSLPGTAFITALQGTWRWWHDAGNPSQSPILNPGDFVFLTMPQSQDDGVQDCVLIALDGGVISEFYFGEVNFNTNAFVAWPIEEVTKGNTNGQIDGSLGGYVYRPNGSNTVRDIRSGTFNITGGTAPGSFPASSRFIVYRL